MAEEYEDGISVELVRACFRYDPEAGKLFWKVKGSGRGKHQIGDEAGGFGARPYSRVTIFGRTFFVHRVAWAIHHGTWPRGFLDHINRVTSDNRICNLREVTLSQNQANRNANRKPGQSQYKGVDRVKAGKWWRARIGTEHLGLFKSELDAAIAYDKAAFERWGDYAKLNFEEKVNA